MSWVVKYYIRCMVLYYRKKNNERRDVIDAPSLGDAIKALYKGLETQKKMGKRVFNLNEGSAIHFRLNNKEYSFIPKNYTPHEVLVRYSHLES